MRNPMAMTDQIAANGARTIMISVVLM